MKSLIKLTTLFMFFTSLTFAQNLFLTNDSTTVSEIADLYEVFEETVINKDVEAHREILLFNNQPVNIIQKFAGGIDFYMNNGNSWTGYFSNPNYAYELRISDIEYLTDGPLAITKAHFKEYFNNNYNAFGEDVFLYLKTSDGWKLATLHNTVQLTTLSNHNGPVFEDNITELPDSLARAIAEKDGTAYNNLFYNARAHYGSIDDLLADDVSISDLYRSRFFSMLTASDNNFSMEYSDVEYEIIDTYLAVLKANYKFSEEGNELHSGTQYWILMAPYGNGWRASTIFNVVKSTTSAENEITEKVGKYGLNQNFPNPFNPTTTLSYNLPEQGTVKLNVYDQLGQIVKSVNEVKTGGTHYFRFNGKDLSSGIYFYTLNFEGNNGLYIDDYAKMLLVK